MNSKLFLAAVLIALATPTLADVGAKDDFLKPPETLDGSTNTSVNILAAPVRKILPADVEPGSVRCTKLNENGYVVFWTYTETGAKRMLAFNEANAGKPTRLAIGKFELQINIAPFKTMPPIFESYKESKEGWLKHRTDKVVAVSEADAKVIVAGLAR